MHFIVDCGSVDYNQCILYVNQEEEDFVESARKPSAGQLTPEELDPDKPSTWLSE
jgi:hypothetical protein